MATLFEIDKALEIALEHGCTEDGEILEEDELKILLDKLKMSKEQKIDNIASYIKNLTVEAEALKKEKQYLEYRQKQKERKITSLKKYLDTFMQYSGMKKYESTRNVISYRKSTVVQINNPDKIPEDLWNISVKKEPSLSKIKEYLKSNKQDKMQGAELVQKNNLTIK